MSFHRKLPLEIYCLILPGILVLTYLVATAPVMLFAANKTVRWIIMESLTHEPPLVVFLVIIYCYASVKIISSIATSARRARQREIIYRSTKKMSVGNTVKTALLSAGFLFTAIAVASAATTFSVLELYLTADRVRTAITSAALMNWDFRLFGVYPSFWLHKLARFPLLEISIVTSYEIIFLATSVVFLFLLAKKDMWRQFVFNFFLVILIAFPIWWFWPALSPNSMYRENILNQKIDRDTSQRISEYPPTFYLKYQLDTINNVYLDRTNQFLNVSTNPSMHAAWGVITAYYGTAFFWPLGIFLIPWAILNAVGAVYIEQHYAVDIIGGILVSVISIWLTNLLFRLEKRYYRGSYQEFFLLTMIENDIAASGNFIKAVYKKFLRYLNGFIGIKP